MEDYLDNLSELIASNDIKDLKKELLDYTCLVFLDTLGAIIAGGLNGKEVRKMAEMVSTTPGKAVLLVDNLPRSIASHAALVNGCAGTWLELEEGNRHARGHPAIHILPAALAMAQELNSSGTELLNAFFVGYETASRIGAHAAMRPGYHPHGTWGTIGSAAAVSRLLKLKTDKIRQALNIAACLTLSAPFKAATEGATARNLFAGVAGANGILAARAADMEFTGLSDGPGEVFSQLTGNHFDSKAAADKLAGTWMIEKNYFKIHGFCRHNHAAIEALMAIKDIEKVSAEDVTRVVIYTHAPASDMGEKDRLSDLAARFSIPYSVVARLVLGTSNETATSEKSLQNKRIQELLGVTEIYEDKSYTNRYPQFRDARVELFSKDGRMLVGRCENPPGDNDIDPYPIEGIEEKFLRLTDPLLGDKNANLLSRCKAIGEFDDVSVLFDNL
jgi:2-methylcitrate dehydratase PrpD